MSFYSSDTQRKILCLPFGNDAKHIVAVGSMRSGKSAAMIRSFLYWAHVCYAGQLFLMTAKSRALVRAVLQRETQAWCDEVGIQPRLIGDQWQIPCASGGPPNEFLVTVYGEGENPVARVQGPTFQGLYADEAVNMQDDYRRMIISRLSPPGSRGFWSTNPDDEQHPFKVEVIDAIEAGTLSGVVIQCGPSDNPVLEAGYYDDLRVNYPHAWQQQRFVEGKWTTASGRVYPRATKSWPDGNQRDLPEGVVPTLFTAGVDWASKSITHAVLVAHTNLGGFVIDEWRWDAEANGPLTEDEQAARIAAQFTAGRSVKRWTVDRTSLGLIHALGQVVEGAVEPGSLTVVDGITKVASLFNADKLFVTSSAPALTEELGKYRWPERHERKPNVQTVKPVKKDDHGADALRYLCEPLARPRSKSRVRGKGSGSAARMGA
ncbi:MAG: terminase family protein, partial [Rhodospirillaceae bacterium]|nr:terminase family protein [Rhodospirillaceae bacterium]